MFEGLVRIIAALLVGCFSLVATTKLFGVMQQAGYKGKAFAKWLFKKENTYVARLSVLATLLFFSAGIVVLCFSFLGDTVALSLSAVPVLFFLLFFCIVDRRFALKVPVKYTGRVKRLAVIYFFFNACAGYALIRLCAFIGDWMTVGGVADWVLLLRYLPVAILPVLLPFLLLLANAITYPFEEGRNRRFVKKAADKIATKETIKVGIVGSFGKTSVKQILTTILSQKYKVCATPASFNTPMGIAKTAFSEGFDEAEVFIAEMGARKAGDIAELCEIVKPDYALFTGVCAQHIETFGSLEGVKKEKSAVFKSGAKVVGGAALKEDVAAEYEALSDEEKANINFLSGEEIKDLKLCFNKTKFTLGVGKESWEVDVPLLGKHSAENIALCVLLAKQMGLSREEIAKGLAEIKPVEHRLQLLEENGVYILDDAYNANERSAVEAIEALRRFEGKKIVVTPGLVETGVLEKELGNRLGETLAKANLDKVVLVGDTQVKPVQVGYEKAGGDKEKLTVCFTLEKAKEALVGELQAGDAVLFLNDLPDVY